MKDRSKFRLSANQAEETAYLREEIIDDGCALLILKSIQKNQQREVLWNVSI
jgi:hypothetical protein